MKFPKKLPITITQQDIDNKKQSSLLSVLNRMFPNTDLILIGGYLVRIADKVEYTMPNDIFITDINTPVSFNLLRVWYKK